MFGLSLEHLLILGVVGLFILGPQRLPETAAWLARTTKTVRGYVSGAKAQIRAELGTDLDELRDTMGTLNSFRRTNPVSAAGKGLLNLATAPEPRPAPESRPDPEAPVKPAAEASEPAEH